MQLPLGNGENMTVVVSFMEPNNVTLPFNVSWIVVDPDSSNYLKVLRRTSALPMPGYRNTWVEVATMEDLIAEPQFWDLSSGFNLGEVEAPQLGAATVDVRGLMQLNREYAPTAITRWLWAATTLACPTPVLRFRTPIRSSPSP